MEQLHEDDDLTGTMWVRRPEVYVVSRIEEAQSLETLSEGWVEARPGQLLLTATDGAVEVVDDAEDLMADFERVEGWEPSMAELATQLQTTAEGIERRLGTLERRLVVWSERLRDDPMARLTFD